MHSEQLPTLGHVSAAKAVRHHLAVVICCLVIGGVLGWLYVATVPRAYTSTASVLVNPSSGNPYAPTPESVRQDELTSLETEAQVARSTEVLGIVASDSNLTTNELERGVQITVPPNTQVLQVSYTAADPNVAQQVANAVADAYLENRERRFDDVTAARLDRVETRTLSAVRDLRAATAAAQTGSGAQRLFQKQLSDVLSNELVSLRSQRTSLESSESPGGTVVSPAMLPSSAPKLTAIVMPVGGALAGLALGCLIAVMLEKFRGVIRSAPEVEAIGLPVIAAVPQPRRRHRHRRDEAAAVDTTIRRLRASLLDRNPRPDVIAVAPTGNGKSNADVSEAVAESFAKAGHRVVLVQTEGPQPAANGGLSVEEPGLAQALLHERLDVLEMLQPSVDPLLSLLPDGGFTAESRELLISDRLREALSSLIEAGHLVVLQSPGIDTAEGEAVVGAADVGLVVVTVGKTRPQEVEQVTKQRRTRAAVLTALIVRPSQSSRHAPRAAAEGQARRDVDSNETTREATAARDQRTRARR
jgi:polysaccharide biosynthesis transport protein